MGSGNVLFFCLISFLNIEIVCAEFSWVEFSSFIRDLNEVLRVGQKMKWSGINHILQFGKVHGPEQRYNDNKRLRYIADAHKTQKQLRQKSNWRRSPRYCCWMRDWQPSGQHFLELSSGLWFMRLQKSNYYFPSHAL